MADKKTTVSDKQYLAKILYTREQLDAKTVCKRVGVSENTMSKWVNDFGWKSLRNRLLVGKEEVLSNLYEQLMELNTDIRKNATGKKYGDSKQADTIIKLTAGIRNLETDLAIADLVESGIRFIKHLQQIAPINAVIEVSDYWNAFLLANIKR